MKTNWRFIQFTGVLLIFTISSCTYMDQFKLDRLSTEIEVTPSLAAPIAFGSFSIADVLAALDSTGFVDQYEDSLLYIYYTDTAYSVEASSLIDIPDRSTETYLEPTPSEILVWNSLPENTTLNLTNTEEFDFQLEEGDRIDRIYLRDGDLIFNVFSEFRHEGSMRVTSDHVFDPDGNELDVTFPISQLDGNYSLDSIVDISGYYMEFDQVNDSAYASVDFILTLQKSASDILPGEESGITMSFENMLFDKIFGFIAQREVLNESQVIDVDLFGEDLVTEVNINFRNPRLNLQVHNSYGLPMIIELQDVFATSTAQGTSTELVFKNDTMNPFEIKAPTMDQLGYSVTTPWNLNSETTNIADIIETAPDKFEFTVIAGTGESDMDAGEQNFVLDSSKLVIEAEVELPMWLKTDGYELPADTVLLEEALGLGDLSFVESANLRLYTTNEWPLQVELQLYFLDESYEPIDSVFDSGLPLLQAADVFPEGEENAGEIIPSSVEEIMNEVDFSGEELMELENAKYIMLKAKAFTTDTGSKFVKFYSGYELSYRVNMAADFVINPDELAIGLDE